MRYISASDLLFSIFLYFQCLFPLANKPLLSYTLEFLARCGVKHIYVYCCHCAEQIKDYLAQSKWSKPCVYTWLFVWLICADLIALHVYNICMFVFFNFFSYYFGQKEKKLVQIYKKLLLLFYALYSSLAGLPLVKWPPLFLVISHQLVMYLETLTKSRFLKVIFCLFQEMSFQMHNLKMH